MWTKNNLYKLVRERFRDYCFIVASNREPYIHTYSGRQIAVQSASTGLTNALDPIMQACGGTWIAHGSGDADNEVVDRFGKVAVPPVEPRYVLKRIWLSKEEQDGYYFGFANKALWPLCHMVYTRPVFREAEWNAYKIVNEKFCRSILEEIGSKKAFIFIQDYHLALLAKFLKERNNNIITAQFWHIPWPNPEAFQICPWQEEILQGLLSNDLLGFHIRYDCNNFLDTVERSLEARVDRDLDEIHYNHKKTVVRPYPISVDYKELSQLARSEAIKNEIEMLKDKFELNGEKIGIGIERFDYAKGIPDQLSAIDRLLDKYPQFQKQMVFIQAGTASRIHIDAYRDLDKEIERQIEHINWKYKSDHWEPIKFFHENHPPLTLMALRLMADFCIVSSLHDGMNLLAKEYVASHYDEDGVLILSSFAGAARELTEALQINPYDTDGFANTIKLALEMPESERKRRMQKMRATVEENNVYKWAADIISDLLNFEFGE